ncbi:patatin-like phospholipase family protein [Rubricoccus marinus]|uniref:Patatin n=1 Tax=Rubricoccus marinus TaxID=716817 RepID=A0A259TU40_9BACT|nr:patatin-like phospholipase family protein [Rubricoccus marinus]OZC01292.1 patatin [Rubricoccus marinus]
METLPDPADPIHDYDPEPDAEALAGAASDVALCLSGGGYRAMLFHVGSLWRLNEAGMLRTLARVSSVSGGSITAGVLALAWDDLGWAGGVATQFETRVADPVRVLASRTLDAGAVLTGVLLPGSVGDKVAAAYARYLFGDATLQDLPDDSAGDAPRFVINATNLQSGKLWRFSRPYMGDWRVGIVREPSVPLARAVAASSAFPPVLSPVVLDLDSSDFDASTGDGLTGRAYREEVVLSDGGVYDNLGLETAWKRHGTVLVSDGGGAFEPDPDPPSDWARHSVRVLGVIDSQVRNLRKRQTIGAFASGRKRGAYWGIRTDIARYGLGDALPCPAPETVRLAETPTRLKRLSDVRQERLINWGYAVCDAALRAHVDPSLPAGAFPYPDAKVG